MLGPRAQRAWRDAGSPDPRRPGSILADKTTSRMGAELVPHPAAQESENHQALCRLGMRSLQRNGRGDFENIPLVLVAPCL